jgi:6-pyruvoyltetrahydropterin/6-carboxytetrahydropterin synthase
MKISVFRKAQFNAAHRLFRREWSDEKNAAVFGPCSNPNYHGHNYSLQVKITGKIDPLTGFLIDLKVVKELIDREIIERFDHKNLNLDTKEFAVLNPTAENIAVVIWQILRKHIDSKYELSVRLGETERNAVEYWGE